MLTVNSAGKNLFIASPFTLVNIISLFQVDLSGRRKKFERKPVTKLFPVKKSSSYENRRLGRNKKIKLLSCAPAEGHCV